MNLKTVISISFCIATLTACKPDLRTIGTVDDDKLITPAMIYDMGTDEFTKKYLGKEVTISNLSEGKFLGGYRPENGQCLFAPVTRDPELKKSIVLYIYANHFPDFVIEDLFKESSPEFTNLLNYPEEIDLPMDVCEERCEYNEDTGACFYKSPHLKVTGKIFRAGEGLDGYYIRMKLKGVQY
ncbi:hypothetical protein [Gynuella sunshinyii]|uniref:Lipoprotein n=1 Tax=Gynuella sunshinyii YC6258 TaxID=1445510 RepID=A0A0C5VHE5_9GAMM|nr:hypothetical protein [Gynuella sunshinyii]AJQ94087.1 hypothetical Protein YC6258_02043 [Gynuella sunshinyii YC6258]